MASIKRYENYSIPLTNFNIFQEKRIMEAEKEAVVDKEIENKFAKAIVEMNFTLLSDLLHDAGVFNIQDEELETKDVKKEQFIHWIINKRKGVTQLQYYFDQCLHCFIGNPVVIFNDGTFPREIHDSSEKSKTGLMLNIVANKIDVVNFCYTLLNTENKYQFEIDGAIIKEYMEKHNPGGSTMDFLEAYHKCKKKGLIRTFKGERD